MDTSEDNRSVVAVTAGFSAVSLLCLLLLSVLPTDSTRDFIVVTAPWESGSARFRILGESGGQLLAEGKLPGTLVVSSETQNFAARLYAAGALFVMQADGLAGCLTLSVRNISGAMEDGV